MKNFARVLTWSLNILTAGALTMPSLAFAGERGDLEMFHLKSYRDREFVKIHPDGREESLSPSALAEVDKAFLSARSRALEVCKSSGSKDVSFSAPPTSKLAFISEDHVKRQYGMYNTGVVAKNVVLAVPRVLGNLITFSGCDGTGAFSMERFRKSFDLSFSDQKTWAKVHLRTQPEGFLGDVEDDVIISKDSPQAMSDMFFESGSFRCHGDKFFAERQVAKDHELKVHSDSDHADASKEISGRQDSGKPMSPVLGSAKGQQSESGSSRE